MLFEIYSALAEEIPQNFANLFGRELNDQNKIWLAVDAQFYPALLFPSDRSDRKADIEFRYVEALFCRDCSISEVASETSTGSFSIVRLKENDPDLVRAFLRLLEETFCRNTRPYSSREIGEKILELAGLFGRIENSRRDILGLWGELFVISSANNSNDAVTCWSVSEHAKFDFTAADFSLEVKTTIRPTRTHRFSLEQLLPRDGTNVFIASLRVTQTLKGHTVGELMEIIQQTITDPIVRKQFFSNCLIKGGEGIYQDEARFQPIPGGSPLIYFDAESLPVPEIEDGSSISNVRFDLCLDRLTPTDETNRIRIRDF